MTRLLIATPQTDELESMWESWRLLGHTFDRRALGKLQCHALPPWTSSL